MPHRDKPADNHDINYLPERYLDAAGWEPPESAEQLRKQRDKYLKANPGLICNETLFEDRRQPAEDDDLEDDRPKTPTNPELFGALWRRGELTVLCGPTGVGKTILAVQLAESIARARRIEPFRAPGSPFRNPHSAIRDRQVLYLDLERTRAQHKDRYSVAISNSRRRREYKFSDRFHHIGLTGGGFTIPELFNGDLARYWQHSVQLALRSTEARIIIIDSLASLDPKRGRSAQARQLRALKLHAATHKLSMLVVVNTRSSQRSAVSSQLKKGRSSGTPPRGLLNSPFTVHHSPLDLAGLGEIGEIADSVFALSPSTMADDIRYIKPLKSNSTQPLLPPNQVLTYRLTRHAGTRASLPATPPRGVLASATEPTEHPETAITPSSDSPLTIHNSPLAPS